MDATLDGRGGKMKKKLKSTFSDSLGLSDDVIERRCICLYHGIRFDAINRLESIFQTGYILPSNKVKRDFVSYDGTVKYLYISNDSDENCNMGTYVSVMPYEDDLEFKLFVRETLFFAIKGTIKAFETTHVSYDEYYDKKNKDECDDYYSYAFNEYFVENDISLDDVIYIGIDSSYFNGNYDKIVEDVINLINVYEIDIPLVDERTNSEIYRLNSKQIIKNKRR